jgi:outer membrane protein assembly factor BamB
MRDRTWSSAVRTGVVVTAAVVALAVGAAPASAAAAAPWRQGDYGPARSSFNSNETVVSASSIAHVAFARSRTAPPVDPASPGCGGGVATQPVVVDHRMFVVLTGRLVAVDLTNGHTLWTVPLDTSLATLYPDLAVVGTRVILASLDCISQSDPSGSVTAYDIATGSQVWSKFFDPGPQSMVVWNNHVLFNGFEAGGGGQVVSISVSSGALQWQYAPGICDGMGDPVVVRNVVIATGCDASFNPQLEGHRLADGALIWHRAGSWDLQRGDNAGSGGSNVFAVNESTGALTDLSPATGATRWSKTNVGDALAVDGSRVYTDCGADTLCALRLTNGSTAWSTTESGIAGHPVAVANGLVLSGGAFDTVVRTSNGSAVNDQFGSPLAIWSSAVSTIAVANGRVVVSGARIVDVYVVPGAT